MAVSPVFAAPLVRAARLSRAAPAAAARLLFALALAAACALPARGADDTVTLNFVNADIDSVVKAVSEITGRNFILDPKIKGTVNIISANPVPKSLVYPTLLSALRLQGVAAIEGNGVTKLVLETDAKMHGSEVVQDRAAGGGDRLVTQVITLRNESATQLVNVLRPLITPNNTIAAFPGTNSLIITDYAENLRRIEKVVASLDQAPAGEPMVVTLKYASALDLVPLVSRLLGAESATAAPGQPADAQQRVTLVADPRSNSVLLRSENSGRAARVKALIEQLDTPGRPGGNMFIVYLKNAEAARVAQTLRALMTGSGDAGTPTSSSGPSAIGNTLGSSMATSGAAGTPASAPPPSSNNPFAGGAGGSGGALPGGLMIQADVASNALLIMGPEPLYNNLRAIIERLDVRRAQVFVEALIVEVSADKAAEFGIQWQFLQGLNKNNLQGFGGTNFGSADSGTAQNNIITGAVNLGALGQGLNAGLIQGTVTIPGLGTITNLALLARALEQTVGANILSTPTLLTLDNEEARIIVGQNVPIVTGQYATTGSTSTVQPFQTVERKDIGVMLRVKPQITEGGTIRLLVYQEVSRIESFTTTTGLVLSKRALESSVVVDDKQVAVLGGLIQDSFSDGSDRVPVIGDLPLIGAFFRYDQRKRQKVNLLIFLKPTVVRTDSQGKELTNERYDYIMNEQEKSRPEFRYFWQDQSVPTLPPPGAMPGTPAGEMSSTRSPPPVNDMPLFLAPTKPVPSPTAPGVTGPMQAPSPPPAAPTPPPALPAAPPPG